MTIDERESPESLSVPLYKEALEYMRACIGTADNILFVARDPGSRHGLKRAHGAPANLGFYLVVPEDVHTLRTMTFRYAYLIDPSDEAVEAVKAMTTEKLTIGRRIASAKKTASALDLF